jgi:hypothetical protein
VYGGVPSLPEADKVLCSPKQMFGFVVEAVTVGLDLDSFKMIELEVSCPHTLLVRNISIPNKNKC